MISPYNERVTIVARVRSALLEYGPFTLSRPMVVGVSGGPDSLCLLDCLHHLGFSLVVAHYDHQLRPDSGEDAHKVAHMAAIRGLPFEQSTGNVAEFAQQEHLSLEEAARILRYRFLFSVARQTGAQAVAVGHTADDQVETVLMHLLRGSGLAGLKGMLAISTYEAWDAQIPLARPLLGVWRSEIEAYCREQSLEPLIDSTNQQVTFFRNRLRHELVPVLQAYNPRAKEILLRTAEVLAGDWVLVEQAVDQAWQYVLLEVSPGACSADRQKLLSLPIGLQRAIIRRMLNVLRPGLRDIDFETVERGVRFLLHPTRSRTQELVQGLSLTWEKGRVILADRSVDLMDERWPWMPPGTELVLEIPGQVCLGVGWAIETERCVPPDSFSAGPVWDAWLNEDALVHPLVVRTARIGERFQPFGLHGRTQKLSDFWINEGVPRKLRGRWPLVCMHDQIAWIPGYRIAEGVKVKDTCKQVVHLRVYRDGV